jgi:hypothetical protein
MGYIVLPGGRCVWCDEVNGAINLSSMLEDLKCIDYTLSYRLSLATALLKLGEENVKKQVIPVVHQDFPLELSRGILAKASLNFKV